MNHRAVLSLSLSALTLGGSVAGCAGGGSHVATSGDVAPKKADLAASRAAAELARGHADAAVRFAEEAVEGRPRQADRRVLLGQSYLKAGRFASARQAFVDALSLDPASGTAALDLALVETGLGDWSAALDTLDAHALTIPAADRGLATALAGDPATAVQILTAAARSPDAGVKTRQNLALALALAGHWPEAKAVAATDLSPADVDTRMTQWAAFVRPVTAADQVAALLGVVPVMDAGQPVALAAPAAARPAAPVKAAAAMPVEGPATPLAMADPVPSVAAMPVAVPPVASVPIVQALPPEHRHAPVMPRHAAVHADVHAARGNWYVQVGAFRNASVARDGWQRTLRRDAAFRGHVPEEATFKASSGIFYRLSVGGFARGEADAICRGYRAHGGACFVRGGAGDQIASWARRDVQLAAR